MSFLRYSALVMVPLLVSPSLASWNDLDLEVPIGTPLDWDKELHQPTPVIATGTPGRAEPKEAAPPVEGPKEEGPKGGTKVEVKKPPPARPRINPAPTVGFSVPNLYNYFRITTQDIMTHVKPQPERKNPSPWEPPLEGAPPPVPEIETGTSTANRPGGRAEPAPKVTMRHGVEGQYPPKIPGELCWLAICTALRMELHPEIVNKAEALAYLYEIGEPCIANGVAPTKGKFTDVPERPPDFPKMKDPIDKMLSKMIVLEICSGYPYSMDPTYAKKTLMLGELAFPTILECSRSNHTFLKHCAVAILANFTSEAAAEALLKLVDSKEDPVTRVRAINGLGRKRYLKAIPVLLKNLSDGDEGIVAATLYALSQIGSVADPKQRVALAKKLGEFLTNPNLDLKWSALAAIARLGAKDKAVASACAQIKSEVKAKADNVKPPPAPPPGSPVGIPGDPPGSKYKILYHAAMLAAAASGDEASTAETMNAGHSNLHKQVQVLAAEAYPHMGKSGMSQAKSLANHQEPAIAIAAVRSLGRYPENLEWIKNIANTGSRAIIKAAALTALYPLDEKATEDACKGIVKGYGGGTDAESNFLVSLALQMLDRMNKNVGEDVLNVVKKAAEAGAFAKRVATSEYDITQAKIDVHPALLEVAVLALGRTQHEPGLPELVKLMEVGSPVRGEAALALGSYGIPNCVVPAAEALLKALVEPSDGFVRFCAYLSLRHMSKKDYFCDYIFGTMPDIWPNALKYRDWIYDVKQSQPKPAEGEKPADKPAE